MTDQFDATVDYYKILGVKQTSTLEEIKHSHVGLALKYHPDVNKDNSSLSKSQWLDIQSAYTVLSNAGDFSFNFVRVSSPYIILIPLSYYIIVTILCVSYL